MPHNNECEAVKDSLFRKTNTKPTHTLTDAIKHHHASNRVTFSPSVTLTFTFPRPPRCTVMFTSSPTFRSSRILYKSELFFTVSPFIPTTTSPRTTSPLIWSRNVHNMQGEPSTLHTSLPKFSPLDSSVFYYVQFTQTNI